MLKTASRLIASAILLVLTGLMAAVASAAPEAVFSWYPGVSQRVLAAIGRVTAALPFSLAEVLLVLLILWVIYSFIGIFLHKTGPIRWLSGVAEGACALVFLFVALWGLNYLNPTHTDSRLGLELRPYAF